MKILARYESNSGGEREIQRTMLELLNQLDGFDNRTETKVLSLKRSTTTKPFHKACLYTDCIRVQIGGYGYKQN